MHREFVKRVETPIDPEEVQGWSGRSNKEMWVLSIFIGILIGLTVYAAFII